MADRFFCADLSNTSATLDGPEAHHALHVLRLNVGSEIHLFDGRGTSVIGVVDATGRREVVVSIQQRHFTEQQDSGQVIVAASPPKGDRMKWMIEKLTELGVDQFIPLRTHRTIVDAGKSKREKLEATIISAAKQCGRDWLMKVTEPVDFKTLISNTAGQHSLHIAHPYPIGKTATDTATNDPPSKMVLVGPEGGFTNDEVAFAAAAGAIPLEWPGTILRVETAAIMAAIVLCGQTHTR
jgi:16S rRNA (uracil1498-N3)-methyltransferase